MYVAVKGGERAIENAHSWLAEERRGDPTVAELTVAQIREQLSLAVNRVMAEGSLYDPDLAALAIKQARGDLIEAIFLIRAYRTTLPRFGYTAPINTAAMAVDRRISATFKDLPGGQVLGPTFDYTHRLLDFKLAAEGNPDPAPQSEATAGPVPHVTGFLNREGLIETEPANDTPPPDLDPGSEFDLSGDPRYAGITVPRTESLKDTIARVLPYYESSIVPHLKAGACVVVSAHGNSLRALVKHLSGISDEEITGLEIPTGQPIIYELDENGAEAESGRDPGRA